MTSKLAFPIRHISVRVPWHDNGWVGTVCNDPRGNSACLKLPRIAESKDEASEIRLASKHFKDLRDFEVPSCLREGSAFMSQHPLVRYHEHPYWKSSPKSHGHIRPTPINYRPYSAPSLPFRWMLRESLSGNGVSGLREHYPLDMVNEKEEPNIGFQTEWWQDLGNQTTLLNTFWEHVKPEKSLVFFYAKQVPLIDEVPGRRILIGVGRVKALGPLTEYLYDGPTEGKLRSILWERMVEHSIRPDFRDGFLLPYHEALEKCRDGEDFDPSEVVALAPEDRFTEFSYGTEHVGDDTAIEALLLLRSALTRSAELLGAEINKQESWIDKELGSLWRNRGPFPGIGAVLYAYGVPMGNFIARALQEHAGDNGSPWSVWFSLLDSPESFLQPELAKCIDRTTATAWKRMSQERRAFLELLSRTDLTPEQAKVLVTPEERRASGIEEDDSAFIDNPYLLYESTRLTPTPVAIGSVDRGLMPAGGVREMFPIPKPSEIATPVDARRLRALSIRELETATLQGDTLVPRERVIETLRRRDHSEDEQRTLANADLLGVAEDELFPGQIRVVEMADSEPAYQLERLGAAGDLIRKTVEGRFSGKRHALTVDWRQQLDNFLKEPPTEPEEAQAEELGRTEKAAALEEIANARLSVLIGSAGTGKTTLLSVLCSHPEVQKGRIVLLAPTGKARVRLEEEVTKQPGLEDLRAYTLAQFLMPSGRYDGRSQRYMLTGQPGERMGHTVIVDECSMLTEEMLASLIESLSGVQRLILVGDPRQLPPIGAGRPFVDIITRLRPDSSNSTFPRMGCSYAELTVPRRQGGVDRDDLELADWFGGEPGPNHDAVFEILSGHRQSDRVRVVHWETAEELSEKLPNVIAEHLGFDAEKDEALQFAESIGGQISGDHAYFNPDRSGAFVETWQLLSPSRQQGWGVDPLNRLIHQRYRAKQVESAADGWRFLKPQGDQLIVYGDKVINTRNTRLQAWRKYPREQGYLANGEIGVVVGQIRTRNFNYKPWELEVEFSTQPGSVVKFRPSHFSGEGDATLELAYALTVHKAQGSEFKSVILVLPKSSYTLLSRELIYTALTRQTEKITILMQGTLIDFQRLSSEQHSETASRLTNVFAPPKQVEIGEKFLEERLIHRTTRGEAVRSKSEVIIANLLHSKELDYGYEATLEINGITKYPDFTIEDDDTGETYYWEHLGMLSDPRYRRGWDRKLAWFKENGILPRSEGGGERGTLITTEDSADGGIDSAAVSELIEELFGA